MVLYRWPAAAAIAWRVSYNNIIVTAMMMVVIVCCWRSREARNARKGAVQIPVVSSSAAHKFPRNYFVIVWLSHYCFHHSARARLRLLAGWHNVEGWMGGLRPCVRGSKADAARKGYRWGWLKAAAVNQSTRNINKYTQRKQQGEAHLVCDVLPVAYAIFMCPPGIVYTPRSQPNSFPLHTTPHVSLPVSIIALLRRNVSLNFINDLQMYLRYRKTSIAATALAPASKNRKLLCYVRANITRLQCNT